jgi:pSer/pThr/pTyr-binding forkhead associated (FHA) protein
LKAETTTVGRVSDNAFEIPEASVSSHHAELVLRGADILVRDLSSTNGTFINGDRVTEGILKSGQILRLGTIEMRLETAVPGAAKAKQSLEQTRVIPQGIKADDLSNTGAAPEFKTTGFEKKSNRGAKLFAIIASIVALLLLSALAWVIIHRTE